MTSKTAVLRLTLRAWSKASLRLMLKSWHRTIGLIAAVFLLVLTVTGLALMQTDRFDLDSRYVANDGLLDWYGIRPAPPPLSFRAMQHRVTQLADRLYFDQRVVTNMPGQLVGALPADGEILVATTNEIILLTEDGEVAERMGVLDDGAGNIRQIGTDSAGEIVVRITDGVRRFDLITASLADAAASPPVTWSIESALPEALGQTLSQNYRGSGLSLERVLLDLHTGRLFGAPGVLIVNTASVLLLVLVVSGLVMWLMRSR